MQMHNLSLVRSSYLKIAKGEKDFKIVNIISGRQFKVDQPTIEVLEYFKQPHKLDEIDCSENMRASLLGLYQKGLLVEVAAQHKETYQVQQYTNQLFGLKTFQAPADRRDIVLVGVPYGGGNPISTATSQFPYLFRRFTENHNLRFTATAPVNYRILGKRQGPRHLPALVQGERLKDGGDLFIHQYESRKQVYDKIEHLFDQLIHQGQLPFAIGGDHSISLPIIKAIDKHYPSFSVLHFDAHTDTYTSKYEKILEAEGTHYHGNFISKVLEMEGVNKVYQFGIRGINNTFIRSEHPKRLSFWAEEVREMIRQNRLDVNIPAGEPLYITFDIDVLDPAIAPATATPIPNGLSFRDTVQLFELLKLQERKIIGVDFVEVNLEKDQQNLTASIATQLMLNLLDYIQL